MIPKAQAKNKPLNKKGIPPKYCENIITETPLYPHKDVKEAVERAEKRLKEKVLGENITKLTYKNKVIKKINKIWKEEFGEFK